MFRQFSSILAKKSEPRIRSPWASNFLLKTYLSWVIILVQTIYSDHISILLITGHLSFFLKELSILVFAYLKIFLLFYYVISMDVLSACVSVQHLCEMTSDVKRVSDPLGLELQMVLSLAPYCRAIHLSSPQSCFLFFCIEIILFHIINSDRSFPRPDPPHPSPSTSTPFSLGKIKQ